MRDRSMGDKKGKSNAEDKRDDQCDSKGEDLKNSRSETKDHLYSKSQPEAHDNVVLENETPTIDAGTDDMVSGYLNLTDDEVQNIDEREVNKVQQSEKMIYEVNQNGPACPMFLINPSTASAGQHSGNNLRIFLQWLPEDQDAFLGKLGTFYGEKVMEFKPPRFYGYRLNCLKLWRSVIKLGDYDRVTLLFCTCI
ncbi:hypothetical protein H5410_061592 [Solanum commersonii]|uniref:Uncharacterized protein n=1 Tax=Solanum commersonii TaxID=4109 RepID=A0A9J5W8G3_SOLCO|nr:hypothetical protein H5410_061592 [Solanum commersonii]